MTKTEFKFWFRLILSIAILAILAFIIYQNWTQVELKILFFSMTMPIILWVALAFFTGLVIGYLFRYAGEQHAPIEEQEVVFPHPSDKGQPDHSAPEASKEESDKEVSQAPVTPQDPPQAPSNSSQL